MRETDGGQFDLMLLFLVAFRKHEPLLVLRGLPIFLFNLRLVIGRNFLSLLPFSAHALKGC